MSQFSSERIVKAQQTLGNQYFLRSIRRNIYNNQQRISRQVYNHQNLKIKTKDSLAFKGTLRDTKFTTQSLQKPKFFKAKGQKKYQQNESLQFSFSSPFKSASSEPRQIGRQDSTYTIASPMSGTLSSFKNTLKDKLSFRVNFVDLNQSKAKMTGFLQKSTSMKEERESVRKRGITQGQLTLSPIKIDLIKQEIVINQASKYPAEQYIIQLSKDKIDKYIRNLHRLQWSCKFLRNQPLSQDSKLYRQHMKNFQFNPDQSVSEQAVSYMISRRYQLISNYLQDIYEERNRFLTEESVSLQRKKLADSSQYPLLSGLKTHSILKMFTKQVKKKKCDPPFQKYPPKVQIFFELPYSEFISYSQTKSSIYQLLGMSAKMGLKMAFSIFDKNRNGLIDEDDLLQLISASRKLLILQIDIAILSRAMLRPKKSSWLGRSRLQESTIQQTQERFQIQQSIVKIQEEQNDSEGNENQQNPLQLSKSRFSIDSHYIFLRDKRIKKKEDSQKKNQRTVVQPLNFAMFCKAFNFKRPFIVYDLFQYIFGASIEDYKQQIQKQIRKHLSKLHISKYEIPQRQQQQTLQQKWNKRLIKSNSIIQQFISKKKRF